MQQTGRLLPSTATQHRTGCVLTCSSSKKIVEIDSGLRIAADNSNGFRASSLFALPCPGVLVGKGGRVGGDGVVDNSREREISAKLAFGRPQDTSAKRTSPSVVTRVRSHDLSHTHRISLFPHHCGIKLTACFEIMKVHRGKRGCSALLKPLFTNFMHPGIDRICVSPKKHLGQRKNLLSSGVVQVRSHDPFHIN